MPYVFGFFSSFQQFRKCHSQHQTRLDAKVMRGHSRYCRVLIDYYSHCGWKTMQQPIIGKRLFEDDRSCNRSHVLMLRGPIPGFELKPVRDEARSSRHDGAAEGLSQLVDQVNKHFAVLNHREMTTKLGVCLQARSRREMAFWWSIFKPCPPIECSLFGFPDALTSSSVRPILHASTVTYGYLYEYILSHLCAIYLGADLRIYTTTYVKPHVSI